jgi:hypothetical protein
MKKYEVEHLTEYERELRKFPWSGVILISVFGFSVIAFFLLMILNT